MSEDTTALHARIAELRAESDRLASIVQQDHIDMTNAIEISERQARDKDAALARAAAAESERDQLVGVVEMQHRALVAIDEDPAELGDATVGLLCCAIAAYDSLEDYDAARHAPTGGES